MHNDRQQKLLNLRQKMRQIERSSGQGAAIKSVTRTSPAGFAAANDEIASENPYTLAPLRTVGPSFLPGQSPKYASGFAPEVLTQHVLHEVLPKTYGDPASIRFLMLALQQNSKCTAQASPILWGSTAHQIHEMGHLFAPGLLTLGLDSNRFIMVRAKNDSELLWVLEEATRSKSFAAVVGEINDIHFTQTRRLSLATQSGATPLFLHRPYHCHGASAAFSRWQIESAQSSQNPFDQYAPGTKQLRVHLLRSRLGQTGSWSLNYETSTHPVFMVCAPANRTFTPQVATNASKRAQAGE